MVPDSDTRGPLFRLPQVTRLRAGPSSCSTDFWGTSHSELACGTWFHALLPICSIECHAGHCIPCLCGPEFSFQYPDEPVSWIHPPKGRWHWAPRVTKGRARRAKHSCAAAA